VARSVRLSGRSLEPGSNARPRGMTAARKGTETGLQSSKPFCRKKQHTRGQ